MSCAISPICALRRTGRRSDHEAGALSDFRADEPTPGLLTERGVVGLAGAVERGHTPQLTMQGLIDGFEQIAAGARAARGRRRGPAARLGAAARAAAAARQDPLLHRQLLGARAARGAAAQHVPEEPGGGGRARRHDRAAGVHRAVDLHARGRAGARHQGPGQEGQPERTGGARSSATPA
mgnify:CR=1 FL=1